MMGLLMALITLACISTPVCRAEGCSRFRNLDNGQTFFRYSGLLVIFRCRPGYKLHGHKTNSCVSGHWSRDPPVCVASGCTYPGPLTHGTSTMNDDGSWAEFSCDSGFQLRGPSMIYCKGHMWNGTKPVCKESDMMSSLSDVRRLISHQGVFASPALKIQQQSHDDHLTNAASKDVDVKSSPLSHAPSQTSTTSGRIPTNNLNVTHQEKSIQLLRLKVKHQAYEAQRPEAEADGWSSAVELTGEEAATLEKESQMFASESHQSTTVSSTVSLVSETERSTSSSPTFPTAQTPAVTPFTTFTVETYSLQQNKLPLPVPALQELTTSQNNATPSADKDRRGESGLFSHFLFHRLPAEKEEPTETPPFTPSTPAQSIINKSSSSSSPASSISSPIGSNTRAQLFNAGLHLDTSTDSGFQWTEHTILRINTTLKSVLSLGRRPVCPYPPVPAHGTFYFRNVENPGPKDYRHYIQYACYPGYTLAHGDIHSFCQHGGTWSGITPVCLGLTPCSVDNGGCSQLCSHSQHYNHSTSHNQTRTQCRCRPGFTLLEDGRTCRDECLEGHHHCPQRSINTFGSFKCTCDDGYQSAHDQIACTDVDECLLPVAVAGCVFGCVNTPGSFYCKCPAGYSLQSANDHCQDIDECVVNEGLGPCTEHCHNSPGSYRCSCTYGRLLAGDGHSCVSACPTGYRKQSTATPDDAQTLKEECVDIDECQEDMCEWQCINLPGSHRCICPRGHTLQRDGRRCKDINECNRRNGGCSHMCVNQRGGYKCACPATHRLSPYSWKKCLPRTTANMYG